ncbi:hypothetical protein A9Q84_19225 [Halobacteriovorax marinus]|uniref:Radical SAM core domain-containing protein n=1 Tax=Halobacteriovorax marinus TaxID=97084 RepID=A0A1Y5F2S3_9BACT|nr:hypothetical protein A9Q84_19225 [Halobacteriovorax marinus]
MKKENKLCSLLWNHLYLNNEGYALPCCAAYEHIEEMLKQSKSITEVSSIEELLKLDLFKDIRQTMLDGKEHTFCSSCYDKEEKGIQSYRQESNELFHETYEKIVTGELNLDSAVSYEYVDLRLGNQCNLACRMCPPNSSSNLIKDYQALESQNFSLDFTKNTSWHKDPNFWQELLSRSHEIKKIYLAGGEPLLINETWDFLGELIKRDHAKNITIYYSTNLTTLPEKAAKFWPSFKTVQLSLSIDGFGDVHEYIRHPIAWKKIEANLHKLDKDFLDLNIESAVVYSTIQAYNFDAIPELVQYLNQFTNIDSYPVISLLTAPNQLSIEALPLDIRKRAIAPLKALLFQAKTSEYKSEKWKSNFIHEVLNLISSLSNENFNKDLFEEFKRYTLHFDKTRSQDIFKRIPELKNYF